jgi:hypothetical protein
MLVSCNLKILVSSYPWERSLTGMINRYPRYDLQKRYAVFYLIGSLSSAFSGIMAFGFDQMNGLGNLGPDYGKRVLVNPKNPALGVASIQGGIAGWRWIFM